LTDAEKALEKSLKEPIDYSSYDKEIADLYKLPIKTFKIIREKDPILKPKVIIITKFLKLEQYNENQEFQRNHETEFKPYVGRPLGRFLIQYDFSPQGEGKQITVVNLTQHYDNYQHACINSGGVCFGNMADMALELFQNCKIYELTSLMLDYLPNPVYETPYKDWKTWFNYNKLQTAQRVKDLIFRGYTSITAKEREWAQISKLIPEKELAILERDYHNDPTFPEVYLMDLHAEHDCHCDNCQLVRFKVNKLKELVETMPEVLDPSITNYSLNISNYEL
jgi:hypothetical protein